MSVRRKKYLPAPRPRDLSRDPALTEGTSDRHFLELPKRALYAHIARRILQHHPIKQIAHQLGYNPSELYNMVRDPYFREIYLDTERTIYGAVDAVMRDQRADIVRRVEAGAPRALTEIFNLIETARSERVRFESAAHLLSLAGHSPIEKRIVAELPVAKMDDATIAKLGEAFQVASRRDAITVKVESSDGKDS